MKRARERHNLAQKLLGQYSASTRLAQKRHGLALKFLGRPEASPPGSACAVVS